MMLTLEEPNVGKSADGHHLGRYMCDCGQSSVTIMSRVQNGYTKSCGCLGRQARPNLRHGMRKSREYSSWSAMIGRCHNPAHKDFPRWGGVGIAVCPEWRASFTAFLAYTGNRPDGTTLDRIDANRGYEPGNVRWATPKEQARNRRDVVMVRTSFGVEKLPDVAERLGITPGAARLRLKRGKLDGVTYA